MIHLIADLRRDLAHAVRLGRTSPALTFAILATLTVSLGAATAVFTLFDVLLLRELPVRNPQHLYAVAPVPNANLEER